MGGFNHKYPHLLTPLLVLFVTICLWVLQKTTPQISTYVEAILFIFGLLFLGIPHGAIDHLLESKNLSSKPNLGFIIKYLSFAAIYLIVWQIFPNLSLIFFLLYSAWHFGEGDLNEWLPKNKNTFKSWAWGAIILSIILGSHLNETNAILTNMKVFSIPINNEEGKISSIFFIFAGLVWAYFEQKGAMIISCLMLAVGTQLPLITSFGLYFIGQHSVNGWSHLKHDLKLNDKSLFVKALPFTIKAFVLFIAIYFVLKSSLLNYSNQQIIASFFILISCISFPHVIAMHKFYRKQR